MKTSERLLNASKTIWDAYNEHPFVLGIQNGTLERDKFRYYIMQDFLYLKDYAKTYAESVGLRLESSAVDCWDNPIPAGTHCSYLKRDIQSRLNRYARDGDITDVWIWAESRSDGKYDLYIGYA